MMHWAWAGLVAAGLLAASDGTAQTYPDKPCR
jgi:hypothetical protein